MLHRSLAGRRLGLLALPLLVLIIGAPLFTLPLTIRANQASPTTAAPPSAIQPGRTPVAVDRLTVPGGGAGSRLGHAFALDRGTLVVSDPDHRRALIFERAADLPLRWALQGMLPLPEGAAVDIKLVDQTLIMATPVTYGSHEIDEPVLVYERDTAAPEGWRLTARLAPPHPDTSVFGPMRLAFDGTTLVVGNPNDQLLGARSGAAYVYERQADARWRLTATLRPHDGDIDSRFGSNVALAGDLIAVKALESSVAGVRANAVHLFARRPGGPQPWVAIAEVHAPDKADFGPLALTPDQLLIGQPLATVGANVAQGRVLTFAPDPTGAWQPTEPIIDPQGAAGRYFGANLALAGANLAVGAPAATGQDPSGDSRVIVFTRNAPRWEPFAYLAAAAANVGLGHAGGLALNNGHVAVTAIEDNQQLAQTTSLHLFEFHAPPQLTPPPVSTAEDTPLTVDVLAAAVPPTDAEQVDPQSLAIIDPPAHGTASIDAGRIVYVPKPNYNGADQLTYQVAGSGGAAATATLAITVEARPDPPQLASFSSSRAAVDEPFATVAQARDPDGDQDLQLILDAAPGWITLDDLGDGTAVLSGIPTAADNGFHPIRLRLVDSTGLASIVERTIEVRPRTPEPPIDLRAAVLAGGQINLAWQNVAAHDDLIYQIEYLNETAEWIRLGSVNWETTSYTVQRLTCPGRHQVRVVAVGPYAVAPSAPLEVELSACPLVPPAEFSAARTARGSVGLSWSGAGNSLASGYRIERSVAGAAWQLLARVTPSSRSYTDSSITCPAEHQYRIRAENNAVLSGYATAALAIVDCSINPPAELSVVPENDAGLTLRWQDQTDIESGFRIERSLDAGATWAELVRVGANTQTYTDLSLLCRTPAVYRVFAFNAGAESPASAEVAATSGSICAPTEPPDLTISATGRRIVELTWPAVPAATDYIIERAPLDSDEWQRVGTAGAAERSFLVTNLSCATGYRLRIFAVNAGGSSPPSAVRTTATQPCSSPIFVAAAATGNRNGASWADAYPDLQLALADARAGDEIWVAAGVYVPTAGTDRTRAFMLVRDVGLYGGFSGSETARAERNWRANPTILSGNLGDPALPGDNSYNVVRAVNTSPATIIDGFTIRDGYANGSFAATAQGHGAGMYTSGAAPTLRNLIFTANRARRGGGLFTDRNHPTLTNILFVGNVADEGGGMAVWQYSNPTLDQVVFSGNTAVQNGGGLYVNWYSAPVLTNATFYGNTGTGAAIAMNAGAQPIVRNSIFAASSGRLGHIARITTNSRMALADSLLDTPPPPAGVPFDGVRVVIGPATFVDPPGADGTLGTPDDDLRLSADSQGIDLGNNAWLPVTLTEDLDGLPRRVDHALRADAGQGATPLVDLGAYEYQPPPPPTAAPGQPTLTPLSRIGINVSWGAVDPAATAVIIERRTADEPWQRIATIPSDQSSYADAALPCGSTQTYRIRAASPGGIGMPGNAVSGATEACEPQIIYVDARATGAASGRSWAAAYPDLQQALGPTTLPGDEIWVAAGIYRPGAPGDRTAAFRLREGIALYGGFSGNETTREQRDWQAHPSILSGDLAGNDPPDVTRYFPGNTGPFAENSLHVVSGSDLSAATILDGFTISDGNAATPQLWQRGGGIYLESSSPHLRNLTIRRNLAGEGGGMFAFANSNPQMDNVRFEENLAQRGGALYLKHSHPQITATQFERNYTDGGDGGAVYALLSYATISGSRFAANDAYHEGGGMAIVAGAPHIIDTQFNANEAMCGGGMYTDNAAPQIERTIFSANRALYVTCGGGGMFVENRSAPYLSDVVFEANRIIENFTAGGGGMFVRASAPYLVNVSFLGNSASEGGAMQNDRGSTPIMLNTVFSGNRATGAAFGALGGGAILNKDSSLVLINATFSGNLAPIGGAMHTLGASPSRIVNSILWNNGTDPSVAELAGNAPIDIQYSIVRGGAAGPGNQDADPRFVDPLGPDGIAGTPDDDLQLQANSPAIDAGTPDELLRTLTIDRNGNPRRTDNPAPDTGVGPAPIIDRGSYETAGNIPEPTPTPSPSATPAPTEPTPSPSATPAPTAPTEPEASPTPEPEIRLGNEQGRSGSIFTLTGVGFPADTTLEVSVGDIPIGTLQTNGTGAFTLHLHTAAGARAGTYVLRVQPPSAPALELTYRLSAAAPLHAVPDDPTNPILDVPVTAIPLEYNRIYLPLLNG